ncbi:MULTISPECIES: outer membrane protein transport protein [unclassified Salinivibrio]|uniref:outer membrane protein transport protein n=1 Tax=unclassified Salinivibrio TaxID=2636825 RepID=UPI00128C8A86|nr:MULTISPECIES: porin [unclassified Salinivibrio]MPS32487.1 long-chain fatty acid transporter [Salinivibrio sp. VYel7]MPX90590.1 long-chain fatty acid transporter [Salinivibrio sp. VYel1]MPX93880.1 long-chain fatty acid transporter [Salinivibrio sp. VYel9]MPX96117.1 long-chain fatty acid transporter [Salinivibrio sp. VYel6]MPY00345.1 long-chain fatty acid transporter [Salinivibrio sp. VYel4]
MSSLFKKSLVATSLSLLAVQAHSAGFQVSETSVSGLGRAFAGEAAIADNAAVGARNAAALTRFNTTAFSGGLSIIDPDVHADVEATSPLTTDAKDIAPTEYVPNIHIIQPIDDKLAVGFSAFSNFGLSTDYPKDFYAGSIAGSTELVTMNFNPNIAYKLNDQWSIGAGISAIYADAELKRQKGALGGASATDQAAKLTGDGWGFGWNLGTLWELDENNRFGLTYRSQTDVTLDGKFTDGTGTKTGVPGSTVDGELELNLPEIIEFSGFHQLNQQFAVHYSAMYTGWDSLKELKATGSQCSDNTCFQKDEGWDNSWRYALGATYTMDEHWAFRAGYAHDESPVPAEKRTLSIPDSDRQWWSLGATYTANENLSIDAGFAFLDGDQVGGTEALTDLQPSDTDFSAGGDAYIYGLQLNYLF